MRTFITTVLGGLVVSITVSGCGPSGQPDPATPAQTASSSGSVSPSRSSATASADSIEAKKTFCDVYAQEIQKTEDTTNRFIAAANGDEQHPNPQWSDPDKWVAGSANDAGIIFGYAADTLEAQVTSALPADISEKAKTLIVSMRKLSGLYANHQATQIPSVSKDEYGKAAEAVDSVCGIA